MKSLDNRRLIVVSNRLPVNVQMNSENKYIVSHSSGGLVTAMSPVLKANDGVWIGWAGNFLEENVKVDELLCKTPECAMYKCRSVDIGLHDYKLYYNGFSNEILWPLFHNVSAYCNYSAEYYNSFKRVNKKFAKTISEEVKKDDFVWIHDYHLINSAKELRKNGLDNTIAFFLHIPFPPPETFSRIPWRLEIIKAMLSYSILGFQTQTDKKNFLETVSLLLKEITIENKNSITKVISNKGETTVGAFPISIDYEEFNKKAKSEEVLNMSKDIKEVYKNQNIMLGVDRLDYSKGIPQRLKAYRTLLQRNTHLHRKVKLIQVMVPSREDISKYTDLKSEIEELIGEINGRFSKPGWIPIQYCYNNLTRTELISYYRASQIALVTPLKDGMNLVAKEYCTSNIDQDGVLILSEFAGAKHQFEKDALLVNPFDEESFVKTMKKALSMKTEDKKRRMSNMQNCVKEFDIYWWVDSFLKTARM